MCTCFLAEVQASTNDSNSHDFGILSTSEATIIFFKIPLLEMIVEVAKVERKVVLVGKSASVVRAVKVGKAKRVRWC